jgi:hypothetical protein
MSTQGKVHSRYLVYRHGTWLGGAKNQMMILRSDQIELCDATAREDSRDYLLLKNIVKIVPSISTLPPNSVNPTDLSLTYGKGEAAKTWTYSCSRRNELIGDFLKITDLFLSTSDEAGKQAKSFPSFSIKIRLNHKETSKYMKVTLTAYSSFMRIKRESIGDDAEDEVGNRL